MPSPPCKHGRRKHLCRESGGSSLCEHGKQKYQCRECGASSLCEHGKRPEGRCARMSSGSSCAPGSGSPHRSFPATLKRANNGGASAPAGERLRVIKTEDDGD